jgi:hypothetical protein
MRHRWLVFLISMLVLQTAEDFSQVPGNCTPTFEPELDAVSSYLIMVEDAILAVALRASMSLC